jgi:hypothetical protein
MEAFADAVGLWALSLCARMIDATLVGPVYLYRGWSAVGPGYLSPASLCAGEASQG